MNEEDYEKWELWEKGEGEAPYGYYGEYVKAKILHNSRCTNKEEKKDAL